MSAKPVVPDPTGPTGPTMSITELEANDRDMLISFFTPDTMKIQNELIMWRDCGFPSHYMFDEMRLIPPPVCSDGVTRQPHEYADFCLGHSMVIDVISFASNLDGIIPYCEWNGSMLSMFLKRG
jgi:hypothetical protein